MWLTLQQNFNKITKFIGTQPLKYCANIMAHKATGMNGDENRSRDNDGEVRHKRSDTQMGTIEQQYGRDFGVRSDMQLGNFLKENGIESLHQLIQSGLGRKD
jgi:hypothetical protein